MRQSASGDGERSRNDDKNLSSLFRLRAFRLLRPSFAYLHFFVRFGLHSHKRAHESFCLIYI